MTGRRGIERLDEATASRIAAGEVVERPASVVKELIENSLDAGARRIRVDIENGGLRLIRITDDGAGIPRSEVELAFERHATSKLRSASELAAVSTLGFRGEALAAIASVSHVTMITRAAGEDAGTRLRLDAGRTVEVQATGAPPGTNITVENLFHAVPARLKFMKTPPSEAKVVTEVVGRYALAFPECRFELYRDGSKVLETEGSGEMRHAAAGVLGGETAAALVPIEGADRELAVVGLASLPGTHRGNRSQVALYVNRRWIHDRSLTFAVVEAYHTLLPKGRFPVAVVMITLPAEMVDVNVHPAKTEVRFREQRQVFAVVQRAVRSAVVQRSGADLSGAATVWSATGPGGRESGRGPWAWAGEIDSEVGFQQLRRVTDPGSRWSSPWRVPPDGPAVGESATDSYPGTLPTLRPLGQIGRAFIAAEGPDGLYLIDQHAAHERVVYERLMSRQEPAATQGLLGTVVVALEPAAMAAFEEHSDVLATIGFEVEQFGPGLVRVLSVPEVLAKGDPSELLRSAVDALGEGTDVVDEAAEARVVRAVCKRASVKAGQVLTDAEMRALLSALEKTVAPWTCPHGRPTVVAISTADLERRFGRR